MIRQLGTSWSDALLVVASTVGIYLAFVLLVRLLGQRTLATVAAFDLAVVVAVGSLIARTSLLREPTLSQGLIALGTLFFLQAAFGQLRRLGRADRLMTRQPVLLVADGAIQHDQLRRAHLLETEVRQKLRLAGVGALSSVQCAVLERNGSVSVLTSGSAVDLDVMVDVPGVDALAAITDAAVPGAPRPTSSDRSGP